MNLLNQNCQNIQLDSEKNSDAQHALLSMFEH